ncbi:MAG TPA: hypothetical protein VHG72_21465 [Polyangia bacterium]|nr:hypothetical protein [Polyangia bacterium]
MRRPFTLACLFLVSLAAACGTITPLSTADGGGGAPGTGGATATGGKNGSGGQGGGETCDQIAADYQAALAADRACTPSAQNQCQKSVADRLGCGGCTTFVTADTNLSQIQNDWNQHDCQVGVCAAVACLPPTSALCKTGDAGGGVCVDQSGVTTN